MIEKINNCPLCGNKEIELRCDISWPHHGRFQEVYCYCFGCEGSTKIAVVREGKND